MDDSNYTNFNVTTKNKQTIFFIFLSTIINLYPSFFRQKKNVINFRSKTFFFFFSYFHLLIPITVIIEFIFKTKKIGNRQICNIIFLFVYVFSLLLLLLFNCTIHFIFCHIIFLTDLIIREKMSVNVLYTMMEKLPENQHTHTHILFT